MKRLHEPYPHLKHCTELVKKEDQVALVVLFDTKLHRYLSDHIFGGKCFVPATMIMELLMEAALWYTRHILKENKYIPVQINKIKIERAIAMAKGDAIAVTIHFQKVFEQDEKIIIEIKIISKRKTHSGKKVGSRINTTAQVVMAKRYDVKNNAEVQHELIEFYSIPQDIYYDKYFPSLGYLFISCTGEFALNREDGIFCGTYNCEDKECQFITGNNTKFLSSPLGNDACLQYAVFFSRILSLKGRLPVGGNEFKVFKRHPTDGNVKVVIKCLHIDDDIMTFDFISFDNDSIIATGKEFKIKKSPYHKDLDVDDFNCMLDKYKLDARC